MSLRKIVLAAPRGFCAGVAYAIEIVDLALQAHGSPLYVRHAIVHNRHVVEGFERRGVQFVEDLEDVPEGSVVVFSAHGVSPAVRAEAADRGLTVIDATCPLVTKVHNEIRRFAAKNKLILYIGHRGHVEAEGSMGVAPGRAILVETPEEAEALELPDHDGLALATQTTLSVDEVTAITSVLLRRFPHLELPAKEDICYATTNRQGAVKALAAACQAVVVVGDPASSNSNRLAEVAEAAGARAVRVMDFSEIPDGFLDGVVAVGITSGASTPEELVDRVIGRLLEGWPEAVLETLQTVEEQIEFMPHRSLIALAQARG